MELAPGSTVDKFVVEEMIGQGGMASVYRIRHRELGVAYALKIMHVTLPELAGRIRSEGSLQAGLQHPNIVTVFDLVDVAGHPALVMEYVEGPSLHAFLHAYRPNLEQVDDIARGILRGVRFAHSKGMIHRDIKPANVLLASADDAYLPKITDFGLAKSLGGGGPSHMQTRTGAVMGTPAYMAPEQFRNSKDVDHRADVYSLGVVLYELVSGQRPYEPDDLFELLDKVRRADYPAITELVPSIPDRMADAIEGAMAVSAADRIPDVDTLYNVWCGRVKVETSRIWDKGVLKSIGKRLESPATPSNPSDLGRAPTPVPLGLPQPASPDTPAPAPQRHAAQATSSALATPPDPHAAPPISEVPSEPEEGEKATVQSIAPETSFQPLAGPEVAVVVPEKQGSPLALDASPPVGVADGLAETSEEGPEPTPVGLDETRFEQRIIAADLAALSSEEVSEDGPPEDGAPEDGDTVKAFLRPSQGARETFKPESAPPKAADGSILVPAGPPIPKDLAASPHVVPATPTPSKEAVEWSTTVPEGSPSLHLPPPPSGPPALPAVPARTFGVAGAGAAAVGLVTVLGGGLALAVGAVLAVGWYFTPEPEPIDPLPPLERPVETDAATDAGTTDGANETEGTDAAGTDAEGTEGTTDAVETDPSTDAATDSPEAQPAPQPAPAPTVKPDPKPKSPSKPTVAKGRVKLTGDASSVRLVSGGKSYSPGWLPAGSYQVWATFPGRGEVDLGVTVQVRAGQSVELYCQASFDTCKVR